MADTELKVKITAEDDASAKLRGIEGSLGNLGGVLKGAFLGAVGLATGALAGLTAGLTDCVKGAMEAEKVQAQLAAVLKSTGGAAGLTADDVNSLATSLSELTPYEDDVIVSAENMLLTFTKIGKDIFPQATETVLNMATAMGGDLQGASIQLGKALNDPIAGVGALSRVGVQFTEDQKAMIKTLVESGDTMGAQKIILQELQTEFGGAAKAAGTTFAGQLEILKNQFGNVKDEIGTALIPVLRDLVTEYGPQLIKFAKEFSAWMKTEGAEDLRVFIGSMKDLVSVMADLIRFFNDPWIKALFSNNPNDMLNLFKSLGINVPKFANGTNFAPGGLAMVGERGPELVNLPRGSQVLPTTNNYNLTIHSQSRTESVTADFALMRALARS